MTSRLLVVVLSALLMAGLNVACQRSDDRVQAARESGVDVNVVSPGDREIANNIEQSHIGELDLARLAQDRGSDKDVKSYAQMLETDHQKALEDLIEILRDKQVTDSVELKPADAQAEMKRLDTMSGAQFDREFLTLMVRNHQKTLDSLNQELTKVQNPDVKDYITNLIPKVRHHMEEAQQLQTKMTGSEKG